MISRTRIAIPFLLLGGIALAGAVRMHSRPQPQAAQQQIRPLSPLDQADLQKRIRELEQNLETEKQKTQELLQHKEDMTRNLERATAQISHLEKAASSKKKPEYSAAIKSAGVLQKKVAQLERSEEKLRKQIQDLEGKFKETGRQKSDLQKEVRNLQAALKRSEHLSEKKQQNQARGLDRLQKQLAESEEARQKLLLRIEQARTSERENERLRKELAKANDRIAELIVSLTVQEELSAQMQVGEKTS